MGRADSLEGQDLGGAVMVKRGWSVTLKARLARALLAFSAAAMARLQTFAARGEASIRNDCRVFAEGRIVNILGNPGHISIGSHARIRGEIVTYAHAGRIVIGSWFYLGPGSMIWSSDETGIEIGDRVLVSANVMIHDTNSHPLDHRARFEQTKAIFGSGHPKSITDIRSAPVTVGDDVWIGAGAVILKGVHIGDRAIIGAGALIADDVPADTLVPAGTIIRRVEEAGP